MYYPVCGLVHIRDTLLLIGMFLSRIEEPVKASTSAHDRHALQQLALKVHVKH